MGAAPSFTQAGTGASPGYSAVDVRRILYATGCTEGYVTSTSYAVVQRAAGANQSTDINASTGDGYIVLGDAVTSQGYYYVPPHSAVINEVVTTADATDPRIDQIVLEVKDDTHDAGGLNLVRTRVVAGTPTAGATLANLSGVASLPSSAARLAYVLVSAGDASIVTADISDQRSAGTPTTTVLYPWTIDIDPLTTAATQTNFSTRQLDTLQVDAAYLTSSGAQNAEVGWDVVLAAGTWTISLLGLKTTSAGIITASLDASDVGTIDQYNGSTSYNQLQTITSISVAATGKKRLLLKVATKNASSSSYTAYITKLRLLRTA